MANITYYRSRILVDVLYFQRKLIQILKIIQEKEVHPIGSTRAKKIDVRIIATASLNLEEKVKEVRIWNYLCISDK